MATRQWGYLAKYTLLRQIQVRVWIPLLTSRTSRRTVPALLTSVEPVLFSCRDIISAIAGVIPPDQFWRWKDMWSNSMRTVVFAAALIEYLRKGSLLSLPRAAETFGSTNYILWIGSPFIIFSSRGVERPVLASSRRLSSWINCDGQRAGDYQL